jgi:hypothetical protein
MPALVKSSVGSSDGTSDDDATTRCPRASKNLRKEERMAAEFI